MDRQFELTVYLCSMADISGEIDEPDASKEFFVRDLAVFRDMDEDVKVVEHECIGEDFKAAEDGQVEHEIEQAFFFEIAKDHAPFNDSGHAMVIASPVSLDSCRAHTEAPLKPSDHVPTYI